MVVCNGHVCEMYTIKDGTVCYRSYQTGRVIKREKPAKKKQKEGNSVKSTLIETLILAGYPEDQIFHHESDLYIFVWWHGKNFADVVRKWYRENGLSTSEFMIGHFKDQITGKPMLDCAFQYTPYWEKR